MPKRKPIPIGTKIGRWTIIDNTDVMHICKCDCGTVKPVKWSNKTGLARDLLSNRVYSLGWSIERAITTPVKTQYRHKSLADREAEKGR